MHGNTGDLDTERAAQGATIGGAPALPGDGVEQPLGREVAPDLAGSEREPAMRSRQRGPRPLVFVLVLTGVMMAFAIIVAVWMYWLAPALTV